MPSTRNHKEMFLSFLYRIANIGTEEEFFKKFKTTTEEVSRFMEGDPLPPSWLTEMFNCQLSNNDYETLNHLLTKIYGPQKEIRGRIRSNKFATYQESKGDFIIN